MSWGSAKSTHPGWPANVLGGPGVFETMRVYSGRVAGFDAHLKRLHASARTVGIRPPAGSVLALRALEALERSGYGNAILRLSLHTEPSGRGEALTGCSVRPFDGCPRAWIADGIRITTAPVRRPAPGAWAPQVKSNDYANAIGAILGMVPDPDRRSADPLMLASSGEVSETTVANLAILRRGALWTPPAACGILLGVTRHAVLESARVLGLGVFETPLTRHDVFNAEEVFLTSAAVEVLPVVEVDGRRIGNGRPGPWTARLREAYLQQVLAE